MSPLQALANYLDRQKRDLSGWVSNPSAQLERNVANWTAPREGVVRQGGLARAAVDPLNTFANPGNWMGAGIIKGKGGNWLKGSVENELASLKHRIMDPLVEPDLVDEIRKHQAANDWIDKQLTRYVKNDMGTEADPIRKLADQGITHTPVLEVGGGLPEIRRKRAKFGFPKDNISQTQLGRNWELRADEAIEPMSLRDIPDFGFEPWMTKANQDQLIYDIPPGIQDGTFDMLGLDHIIDSINHHLDSGVYTPDMLTNLSIERAVRDTHQWNQDMAAKMQASKDAASSFGTVHKDYGDGMKWVELKPAEKASAKVVKLEDGMYGVINPAGMQLNGKWKTPDDAQSVIEEFRTNPNYDNFNPRLSEDDYNALQNALRYEGDTMGHCVGGYCDDVVSGRSKIYSLRDEKNRPHVTIETNPVGENSWSGISSGYPEDLVNQLDDLANTNPNIRGLKLHALAKEQGIPVPDLPSSIVQIKGKQNAKPVDKYLPYVQDFVKSGKWGEIGDYANTGLIRKHALTPEEQVLFPNQDHFTLDEIKNMRQGKNWTLIDNDPELGLEYHPDWDAPEQ